MGCAERIVVGLGVVTGMFAFYKAGEGYCARRVSGRKESLYDASKCLILKLRDKEIDFLKIAECPL